MKAVITQDLSKDSDYVDSKWETAFLKVKYS
jgi:hypothetical protein